MRFFFKLFKRSLLILNNKFSLLITYFKFYVNGISIPKGLISNGIPMINVSLDGSLSIGENCWINSGNYNNVIGRQQPTYLSVGAKASLLIGNNVGMSSVAIICRSKIIIEDDVRIGGGVVIYDTDFHSLKYHNRISGSDELDIKSEPVTIKKGAFLGAHSIVLKGVTVGKYSILGAGSVLTKSIPDGEIWGGNPARFLKTVEL